MNPPLNTKICEESQKGVLDGTNSFALQPTINIKRQ